MAFDLKGYTDLSVAMLRMGLLTYGGGPAVIPLARYEAVEKYRWMNDEEFGEIVAIANALPGPIGTKMAASLGYHRKGTIGSILAIFIHIFPTTLGMVLLLGVLTILNHSKIVHGMIAAVAPVIVVLLAIMTYEFAENAWTGLGRWVGSVFIIFAFVALALLNLNPGIVVAAFLAYGAAHFPLFKWAKGRWRGKSNGDVKPPQTTDSSTGA